MLFFTGVVRRFAALLLIALAVSGKFGTRSLVSRVFALAGIAVFLAIVLQAPAWS